MSRTILVIEDDDSSRALLAMALEHAGYDVATLANGDDLTTTLATTRPDLALVDLYLGEGPNGFDVARAIRKQSDAAVIFLSGAASLDDRLDGFDAGGDDYVVKPVSVAELLARVDAVLRRIRANETGKLCAGDITVDETTTSATRQGIDLHLTPVEFSLLRALLRNRSRVMSKRELLAEVWGFEDFDQNLVEVYVSSLRRKTEAHGPRVIHTIRGAGYVFRS